MVDLDAVLLAFCELLATPIKFEGINRGIRTQSRIEHVKSHLVAFLSTRYSHQALVAILLWLVDLNDTTTQVTNFVDLSTTLADYGTNHIVRDENLLG